MISVNHGRNKLDENKYILESHTSKLYAIAPRCDMNVSGNKALENTER